MNIKVNNKTSLIYAVVLVLCVASMHSFSANTNKDLDKVTIKLSEKKSQHGHHIYMPPREIILAHMVKHGKITQKEISTQRKKRIAQRKELKALKKAGNKEAFHLRLAEIKKEHKLRRKQIKEYLNNNQALKKEIRESKNKYKKQRKNKRQTQKLIEKTPPKTENK